MENWPANEPVLREAGREAGNRSQHTFIITAVTEQWCPWTLDATNNKRANCHSIFEPCPHTLRFLTPSENEAWLPQKLTEQRFHFK